jgi:hypothetical protein
MIQVNNLSISIYKSKDDLLKKVAKELKVKQTDIIKFDVIKKSIDARKKEDVKYVYSLAVEVKEETKLLKKLAGSINISKYEESTYILPQQGGINLKHRPVVVGFGPAGIFAALLLARCGFKPIVIERGEDVDKRSLSVDKFWEENILNTESNVSFGEGGAGTFSDGKLNTMVKDKSGRNNEVLKTLVEFNAPKDILTDPKPHIGTDLLKGIIKNIREEIIKLGGEVRFSSKLEDINYKEGYLRSIKLNNGEILDCEVLVLAIGHSARDTFELLYEKKLNIEAKSFAVGLRVQHPQSMINISQYGKEAADILPTASYKLTTKSSAARGVYSFCMCPGGYVVNASTEKGGLAINGMSYHDRKSESANSAIIVTVDAKEFADETPLAGMYLQRELESKCYKAGNSYIPVQLLGDFIKGRESMEFGETKPCFKGKYTFSRLDKILPDFIVAALKEAFAAFDKKIEGFAREDAILAAIESRTSSPIRIVRDENLEASIRGIYPSGEGAGYAGGISSAAMDGLKVAEAIISKYNSSLINS